MSTGYITEADEVVVQLDSLKIDGIPPDLWPLQYFPDKVPRMKFPRSYVEPRDTTVTCITGRWDADSRTHVRSVEHASGKVYFPFYVTKSKVAFTVGKDVSEVDGEVVFQHDTPDDSDWIRRYLHLRIDV